MEKILNNKVLVITERFFPEQFLINDLIQNWVADGIKVNVLTQVPSYPYDKVYRGYSNTNISVNNDLGANVYRFKTVLGYKKSVIRKILNYFSFMCLSTFHVLKASKDCKTVFVYHTGPLTLAFSVIILKLLSNKKIIIWTQDVWPDAVFAYGFPSQGPFAVILKYLVKTIYRNVDSILVSSPGFVERVKPYIPKNTSVTYIPQWVPDEFHENVSANIEYIPNTKRFVFAGNIGKMQGLDNIIKAFHLVYKNNPDIYLYILGDGTYKNKLIDLVNHENIKNVIFLGRVNSNQVKYCLDKADFLLLPLIKNELIELTIPAKFQTYLACKKPILAVTNGEVSSIVKEFNIGETADPDSIESIVESIKILNTYSIKKIEQCEKIMESLLKTTFNKTNIVAKINNFVLFK